MWKEGYGQIMLKHCPTHVRSVEHMTIDEPLNYASKYVCWWIGRWPLRSSCNINATRCVGTEVVRVVNPVSIIFLTLRGTLKELLGCSNDRISVVGCTSVVTSLALASARHQQSHDLLKQATATSLRYDMILSEEPRPRDIIIFNCHFVFLVFRKWADRRIACWSQV